MRFAYADPPYLGCCGLYDHTHPDGRCWDDPETHRLLIAQLSEEFPDGWALSLSEPSLRVILPLTPPDVRTMAWCKSFASFKPNVGLAYTWEPVLLRGGRRIGRDQATVQDHVVEPITLRKGLTGAKPLRFCRWVIAALNVQEDDEVVDLFPGTGIMGRALQHRRLAV